MTVPDPMLYVPDRQSMLKACARLSGRGFYLKDMEDATIDDTVSAIDAAYQDVPDICYLYLDDGSLYITASDEPARVSSHPLTRVNSLDHMLAYVGRAVRP